MKKIMYVIAFVLFIVTGCTVYYDEIGSIKITQAPLKTEYFQGDTLDTTGLKVVKVYEKNNIEDEIEYEDLKFIGFDSSKIGTQKIIVEYEENGITEYASFEVKVVKKLKNINIATTPRTVFFKGEQFNTDNMVVTATFEDGTTETVTDYSIGYPDMTTTGMKTIIVSLNRNGIVAQITYEINIYELSKIEVRSNPYLTTYTEDDILDITGLKVYGVSTNSISQEITNYATITPVNGSNLTTANTKIIITFLNKTAEIAITVNAKK